MNPSRPAGAFGAVLLAAGLLAAQTAEGASGTPDVSGAWTVTGRVAGFGFTARCELKQAARGLGGVCTDGATSDPRIKGGRAHVLTRGSVDGDRIAWTYRSSFLLSHFDVDYSGVRRGDRMSGGITAQGHTGAFTAVRSAP